MKKLIILSLVCILVFAVSVPAFALNSKNHPDLTSKQISILKDYGLTDKQIDDISIEEIRNVLRTGKKIGKKADWDKNRLTEDIKEKLDKKNLSQSQINQLNNRGYTYEQILEMDAKTIESLLGPITILSAPPGFIGPITVPDGGGSNEYFHWDVAVDSSSLNWYCSDSKEYAQYIYSEYSNPLPSVLTWSHYLYGEWDDTYQTHQGVDVYHYNGRPVRNVTGNNSYKGRVLATSSTSLGGYVQVYDSYLDETITYMHIGTPTVSPGQLITAGTQIGTQSYTYQHTHFQAYDGESTYIAPARYNTLETRIPYGFMTWWI